MIRSWPYCTLAVLWLVAPPLPAQPPIDFGRLEETATAELKEARIPGAAVAIVRGEQVLFTKGFGVASVEAGAPVTPDMLFRLGSTTKMFTAAAVVNLARQGKLELDAPIGRYVKNLPPFLASLTAHQLLTHTAGITDEAPMFGRHDDDALGRGIRTWTPDFVFAPPGKVFSYSNPGFWLAGLVAEEVDGKPYADVLHDRLFQPLGMKRTTFRPTMAMTYPLAVGHGPGQSTAAVIRPMADNTASWPAGSLFSSATDLARWAVALLNDGQLEGKEVLPPEVVRALSTRHVAVPGGDRHYGYGLMVGDLRGVPVAEHSGSRSGYGSLIRFLPEQKAAVIILANRTGGQLPRTAELATTLLAPLGPRPAAVPAPPPLTAEEIARVVGTYTNNRERVELFEREGKLYVRQGQRETPATKVGPNRLRTTGGEYIVVPGEDGKPEYLHHGSRSLRRVGK